jgi:hypothetical protein
MSGNSAACSKTLWGNEARARFCGTFLPATILAACKASHVVISPNDIHGRRIRLVDAHCSLMVEAVGASGEQMLRKSSSRFFIMSRRLTTIHFWAICASFDL